MLTATPLVQDFHRSGGARETRTLAPVTRSTSLAGTPLHQLEYCSMSLFKSTTIQRLNQQFFYNFNFIFEGIKSKVNFKSYK